MYDGPPARLYGHDLNDFGRSELYGFKERHLCNNSIEIPFVGIGILAPSR